MKTGIYTDNRTGLRGSLLISALIHLGIIALLIYMSGAISAGMMIAGAPALEIIPVQFEPAPPPAEPAPALPPDIDISTFADAMAEPVFVETAVIETAQAKPPAPAAFERMEYDLPPFPRKAAPAPARPAPPAGPTRGIEAIALSKPEYPRQARMLGQEGVVALRVRVGGDGRVTGCEVIESSGIRSFDDAARKSALAGKFKPALENGAPRDSEITLRFRFRLDD